MLSSFACSACLCLLHRGSVFATTRGPVALGAMKERLLEFFDRYFGSIV